jgi:hypothetical protein
VPWTSADASEYRDKGNVEFRNRLVNGFIPDGSRPKPSQDHTSAVTTTHATIAVVDEISSIKYSSCTGDTLETSLEELDYLNPGINTSKSTVGFVDLSIAHGPRTLSTSHSSEWPIGLLPNLNSPTCNYSEVINTDNKALTFVNVDPLRPTTIGRQKRRPFAIGDRAETKATRQLKACLRCRMQRIRVSRNKMSGLSLEKPHSHLNSVKLMRKIPVGLASRVRARPWFKRFTLFHACVID